uniref:Snurportin-1 n=1 Tax=Cacopsylla melanoneura TaxID=428564 RepID=A0A8D9EBY5_9HEMI
MAYNNYGFGRSGFSGGYSSSGYGSSGGYGSGSRSGGFSSFRDSGRDPPVFFPSQLNNRKDNYKQSGSGRFANQEQRRRDMLHEQRNRRSDSHNKGRFGNQQQRKKKVPQAPPKPREYKDILSYSEYLLERPDDLEQWVVVACPKGKRCTLVAHKGMTTQYDKQGRPTANFPTNLPGGCDPLHLNPNHGAMRKTILDCVYSEADSTFYVLDLIMWNLHPFIECETSLRFFWLQTRLEEVDVASVNKCNAYRILPAVRFNVIDMQPPLLQPALYPDNRPVTDGFLFYHPEAIYQSGNTPLVGWLKGYMIPEIIEHIQLHPLYIEETPDNYKNLRDYVAEVGNDYGQKKKKKKPGKDGEKMETDGTSGGAGAANPTQGVEAMED